MQKTFHPIKTPPSKALLGHRILERDEHKREIAEQLEKYFEEVDARRQPGSPEEAEEIINEAMRSVRPGYRPHR
ncbi:MAG TPA: hypothetical protein VKZ53_15970 [Candidatus Angelobacter sp.]|nr:hypothetical protein [Candidatus Angelobacter sp.]